MADKMPEIRVVKNGDDSSFLKFRIVDFQEMSDIPLVVRYRLREGDREFFEGFGGPFLRSDTVDDVVLSTIIFGIHSTLSQLSCDCDDLIYDLTEAGYEPGEDGEDLIGRIKAFSDSLDNMTADMEFMEISYSRFVGAVCVGLASPEIGNRNEIRNALEEAITDVITKCRNIDELLDPLLDQYNVLEDEVNEYLDDLMAGPFDPAEFYDDDDDAGDKDLPL